MNDLTPLKAQVLQALSIIDRLESRLLRMQRFETDSLKRTRALERAALTCTNCGAVLVCPLCGADPGAKGPQ